MKGSNTAGQKTALVFIRGVVVGALCGAVVCALLLAICAFVFVSSESIPHSFLPVFAIVVSGVSAFCAGFVTAKISKRLGLALGAASGLLLFLLFTLAGFAVSQTASAAVAFARLLLMAVAGGIGGLLSVNRKSRRK